MKTFDQNYWTSRYQNNETGWDAGKITTPLKEYIDQLTNKDISILIPGAGNAHEAEYLFRRGFHQVTVIDISEEPLKNMKQRVPDFPKEQLIHDDFFKHEAHYDLILEQTFFCALPPSMRQAYADKMALLLKPGGKLVGLLFNNPMNPDQPPFGGDEQEYRGYFSHLFNFHTFNPCYNSIKPREGKELFICLSKKKSG